MNKLSSFTLAVSVCLSLPLTAAEELISSVDLQLPTDVKGTWVLANDESDGEQYMKEWLLIRKPGESFESTDWVISIHKLKVSKRTSSKKFLSNTMRLFKEFCTDVRYVHPKKIKVEKLKAYVGLSMCAQRHGEPYGLHSNQWVLSDNHNIYVVTSEIRTPPSDVAGVHSFSGEKHKINEFFAKTAKSASVVHEGIQVCFRNKKDCWKRKGEK